jgi:hypothetical protein
MTLTLAVGIILVVLIEVLIKGLFPVGLATEPVRVKRK